MSARSVAAEVLVRVERDKAFAAAALEAEIARAVQLDPRDRALATELVYGSLRVLPWLRVQIEKHARKGKSNVDPKTFAQIAVAAYQLFFLTRVPAFAAVNEAVEGVRRAKGPRVAAFANAVLRKLATEAGEMAQMGNGRERLLIDALATSTAPWLSEALARSLGEDDAKRFLEASMVPPPVCLRVEDARERDAWIEKLRAAAEGADIEAGKASPLAITLRGAGKPQALPGFREGAWSVQEEGSQVVALAVGARPGEHVLDACAGRGNKSALLARAVRPSGALDAADVHASKLDRLRDELTRVGLAPRALHSVDWTVGSGDVTELYDRVLVDAPCSGIGTLRRRPELAARRAGEDLAALAAMQLAICVRAADHVKPGGRLVYAVCSVLREEAEDVVEKLCAARPELAPDVFDADAVRAIARDASSFRLLPYAEGTDGYFVAMLRTRAP